MPMFSANCRLYRPPRPAQHRGNHLGIEPGSSAVTVLSQRRPDRPAIVSYGGNRSRFKGAVRCQFPPWPHPVHTTAELNAQLCSYRGDKAARHRAEVTRMPPRVQRMSGDRQKIPSDRIGEPAVICRQKQHPDRHAIVSSGGSVRRLRVVSTSGSIRGSYEKFGSDPSTTTVRGPPAP